MTEIPEHLLKRSRDAKRAKGLDVPDEAPSEAPATSANAPAVPAGAKPAASAPVPIPAAPPTPPTPPTPVWVAAAESRKKVPYWVMPVLLFLPIWLIMYVGTLEEPTREEGVLYEGGLVYTESGCSACHGGGGGGGVGPAFTNGAIIETFTDFASQTSWIVHGTDGYREAGLETYGNGVPVGGSGAVMPAFGADLTTQELIYVVFYERIALGGYEDELPLAEAIFDALDHGELEVPEHFAEGPDGDFTAEIAAMFADIVAEFGSEEVAAE